MDEELKETLNGLYKNASREDLILMLLAAKRRDESLRAKKATISPDEMQRINEILQVFSSYIEGHYYFDIVVSAKFGVIEIDIDGNYQYFSDADSLFYELVNQIYNDVRGLHLNGEHLRITINGELEKAELKHRVSQYLNALQDKEHYSNVFQNFLDDYSDPSDFGSD